MAGDFTQVGVEVVAKNANVVIKQLTVLNQTIVKSGKASKTAAKDSSKFGDALGGVQKAIGFLGLGVTVQQLGKFAVESFKAAAAAERLGNATDSLAQNIGSSGNAMVSAITNASQETISKTDAMSAANKALLFGIVQNEQEMAEMTQIAITLGAAMGQDATKSLDDLTTALGRQSPMILDNLGITLKLEEAYRIYADSLGVSVDSLTEQQKKQAFLNAALIKGRIRVEELGGVTLDTAAKSEQLSAAWSDFTVEFGKLLIMAEKGSGILLWTIDGLERGSRAWQGMFSDLGAHIAANEQLHLERAAANGVTEAIEKLAKQREADMEATIASNKASFNASVAAGKYNKALDDETEALTKTEIMAQKYGVSVKVGADKAIDAYWTRAEAAKKASADEAQAYEESIKAQQEALKTLATDTAGYYTSLREVQNEQAASEQAFNDQMASIHSEGGEKAKAAQASLSDELAKIEAERQEKIAWVRTGAWNRTQEQEAIEEAFWNQSFDERVSLTEQKYSEQAAAVEAGLAQQQAAAQAARDRELAEQQEHLNELKLNAALATLETTGQLAQFTGGLAVSAQEAANLIKAGVLPVTDELAVAIQNTLGQLQTQEAQTATQAQANQSVLQDALAGTLVPLEQQAAVVGTELPAGLAKAETAMGLFNENSQLGLMNTNLATTNEDLALQNVSNITLPLLDQAMLTMNTQAQTGLIETQAQTQTEDDILNTMGTSTLPTVTASFDNAAAAGKNMAEEVGDALDSLKDNLDEFESIVKDITEQLEGLANEAERAFSSASGAISEVASHAGLGLSDGIGFSGGVGLQDGLGLGWKVPSGYPNDSFGPLFVESGEEVLVTPRGTSIDNVVMDRLMSDSLVNASMTVNNFEMNVSTVASPQAVIQQYEVAQALIQQ